MTSHFEHRYEIGDIVYLVTDVDQNPRIVTGFIIEEKQSLLYIIGCGSTDSRHFEYEITHEKTIF